MRGRPPIPLDILKARGSWKGRPQHRKGKFNVGIGAPECPQWLPYPAKQAWRELAPELEAAGVLTRIDADALAMYCIKWASWRKAEEDIARRGSIVDGKQNLNVIMARDLSNWLARTQKEFGLTPASRPRIDAQQMEEEDQDDGNNLLQIG